MISLPIFEDEKPEEVEVDLDLFPLHPADPLHLDVVAQVSLGEGNYSVPAGCVPAFKAVKDDFLLIKRKSCANLGVCCRDLLN